jgi:hypothetical protein
MDSYKLKFQNGRCCTIECDNTKSFQDKINNAENRFNSECVAINDNPIKKHSLGGFLVGATIGAILGNSVPAKTVSKTVSGVKKTTKQVTKKVKNQVRKFAGGGSTNNPEFEDNETDDISFWDNESLALYLGVSASWVKANRKDAIEQAESLRDMSNQGYYAKGKKLTGVPHWWNKQVRDYQFFVFNTNTNKVWAGNEYESDAKDELKEFLSDNPNLPLKVLTKRAITNKKINPLAYESWARSSEIFAEIKGEKFANGGKIKWVLFNKEEDKAYENAIEYYLNQGYSDLKAEKLAIADLKKEFPRLKTELVGNYKISLGTSISSEFGNGGSAKQKRYCRLADDTGKGINEGYVVGDGEMYFETEKALIKYLRENEEDSKDLSDDFILKDGYDNEMYYYTEWNCDSEIEEQGYYYTRSGKEIEINSEKFADGGMSSMALASASPQLAIADQISQRLPETTKAIDKKFAERVYSDKPKWYEDRGMKEYGNGGSVEDNLLKELHRLQRDLNSSRLMKYREGDNSEEEIARKRERESKLTRFNEVLKLLNESKKQYATGGTIGQEITFKHWSGDIKKGTINEDLGNGNFEVASGYGNVLVNKDDIISYDKESQPKKKFLGLFEQGGGVRKLNKSDAIIYKDETWYVTEKNGVTGIANFRQGAWGSDYPFIPLSKINIETDITDMYGNKVMFAKGGGVREINGREYSFGRAWTNDHKHHNKRENYEVPQNARKRKFEDGGLLNDKGLLVGDKANPNDYVLIKSISGKDPITFVVSKKEFAKIPEESFRSKSESFLESVSYTNDYGFNYKFVELVTDQKKVADYLKGYNHSIYKIIIDKENPLDFDVQSSVVWK